MCLRQQENICWIQRQRLSSTNRKPSLRPPSSRKRRQQPQANPARELNISHPPAAYHLASAAAVDIEADISALTRYLPALVGAQAILAAGPARKWMGRAPQQALLAATAASEEAAAVAAARQARGGELHKRIRCRRNRRRWTMWHSEFWKISAAGVI